MDEATYAEADGALIETIDLHLSEVFGPSEGVRLIGRSPHGVVHLHYFEPTQEFPVWTVATSGMSQSAMRPLPGAEECTHAELVMHLPPDWDMESDEAFWPMHALGYYAMMPHINNTYLWDGHTIPSELVTQYPMKRFTCGLITAHCLCEVEDLDMPDGRMISFFNVAFLFKKEVDCKLKEGLDGLLDRMQKRKLNKLDLLVVNPKRKNACGGFFGFGR